jgi:hypothetical protein
MRLPQQVCPQQKRQHWWKRFVRYLFPLDHPHWQSLRSPVTRPYRSHFLSGPRFRLYTHALLLESRIFPNVELCDESPDYTPYGFADIWKGSYHGEPVCIKAIRTLDAARLRGIRNVCGSFILSRARSVHPIPDLLPRSRRT